MTTDPVAVRGPDLGAPEESALRRPRMLRTQIILLTLLTTALFVTALSLDVRAARLSQAVLQCERLGAQSLTVYSVTHNAALAASLATVRDVLGTPAVPNPPAADPLSSVTLPAASSPSVSDPIQQTAGQTLSGLTVPETAGVDWQAALQTMARSVDLLISVAPQSATPLRAAWADFSTQATRPGGVDWKTAERLNSAADRCAVALLTDARRLKVWAAILTGLSVALPLTGIVLLTASVRRLRRSERRLADRQRAWETLLESTEEGIFSLDRQGLFSYLNRTAAEMLGYRPEELVGKDFHSLVRHSRADGSPLSADDDSLLQSLRAGEACRTHEEVFWRRDGSPLPVEYACSPLLEESGRQGSVITFTDVTERRELETLRDDLNGMIVHDLRTPLTSLLTGLQTLGMIGGLNPEQQEFLDIATQGGQTLLAMVNDLLDISKMESGSLKLQAAAVDPAEVIALAMSRSLSSPSRTT